MQYGLSKHFEDGEGEGEDERVRDCEIGGRERGGGKQTKNNE